MGEVGHVNDERDGPQGVSPEVGALVVDVLQQGGRHDVDRRLLPHFLHAYVHNSAEGRLLALQQLGYREEELRAFVLAEVFALVE